jgi:putative oxidoreductase
MSARCATRRDGSISRGRKSASALPYAASDKRPGTSLAAPAEVLSLLHNPRLGYHVLRLSVAGMMLLHGIAKLTRGVSGIEHMLAARGVPGVIAYAVFVGEVGAPLLVIAGFWVQLAALVMAVNMVVAVALVHSHDVFALGRSGGWAIELQALFLFASIAIALLARPGRRG